RAAGAPLPPLPRPPPLRRALLPPPPPAGGDLGLLLKGLCEPRQGRTLEGVGGTLRQRPFFLPTQLLDGPLPARRGAAVVAGLQVDQRPRRAAPQVAGAAATGVLAPAPRHVGGDAGVEGAILGFDHVDQPAAGLPALLQLLSPSLPPPRRPGRRARIRALFAPTGRLP